MGIIGWRKKFSLFDNCPEYFSRPEINVNRQNDQQ